MKYRAEIDGLRAIAVLPVIFFHAGFETFSGGYIGVDVFFVISGYLISTIIFTQTAQGNFSIAQFYENRARRILPALFFIMLCCLPFAWAWMNLFQWYEFSRSLIWTSFFGSNIFFWQHSGYFASASEMKPLLHTWSLAVEEQYYLVFPLLVMLLWKLGKRTLFIVLMAIGLYSFYYCVKTAMTDPSANFFLTLSRIWELLIGSLCAAIVIARAKRNHITSKKWIAEVLGIIGLMLILGPVYYFDQTTPFPSAYTLLPTVGTALIILWAAQDTAVGKILSHRSLVFIGLISYSAYLWHQPIFAFARIRLIEEPSTLVMLALSILGLVLAYLTWKFIEQPFRTKKQLQSEQRKSTFLTNRYQVFAAAILGTFFFASTGHTFAKSHITRPHDKEAKIVEAQLRKARADRAAVLQFNKCHVVKLWDWENNWDCNRDAEVNAALKPVGIVIVGDSHAADKAGSLRIHGLAPLQFSGSSCSLVPSLMTNNCRRFLTHYRDQIRDDDQITELWLSNNFIADELSSDALTEMINFWSPTHKKMVFFANVPIYLNLTEMLMVGESSPRYVEPEPDFSRYEFTMRPDIRAFLDDNDIIFVDTISLLCERKELCNYKAEDGTLLNSDKAHFSVTTFRTFGKKLICSGKSEALNQVVDRSEFCESSQ